MKILHICIASAFTEGMSYQDNLLSEQNLRDGHDVTVISDCHKFVQGRLVYTPPEDLILDNGLHLIRVEYKKIINNFVSSKIRCVPNLYDMITKIGPEVILFHGVAGWELITVAKYKKNHPTISLYIDSHEDFNNSGTNFLSRVLLYRCFNRILTKKALQYTDKILYITYESFQFLKKLYKVPDHKLEYYPLGGIIFGETNRVSIRKKIRKELFIEDDEIILLHSGKMDKLKRTEDIIRAFHKTTDRKLNLILIGSFEEELKSNLEQLVQQDNRIKFLGWKTANELLEYLCACDLYVQPGSQSATMQNALCCGCAVAVYPYISHKWLLNDHAFYIETVEDMITLFNEIINNPNKLHDMQQKGFTLAKEVLDYKVLAKRLYN